MFKKLTSIFLALFFLVSSSHLSFATHFCGGHVSKQALLIDISDFGCGMEQEKVNSCYNHLQLTEKNCCDTKLVQYFIKDNFQSSKEDINIMQQATSLLHIATILFPFPNNVEKFIPFKINKIPLPEKDIPVLFQSFLI